MKTIRVYLSIMAFTLSICGALASTYLTLSDPVYEFIDYPGTEDDMCLAIDLEGCNPTGMFPCKCIIGSVIYRTNYNVSTQCGSALWRNPQPVCIMNP